MALSRVMIRTNVFGKGAKETIQANGEARVFFNPTQYQLQRQVAWEELPNTGTTTPILQSPKGSPRSLALSLVFDTYETREDVRSQTRKIAKLAEVDSEAARPPICTISWGPTVDPFAGLPFTGVVESLTQKFTLFLEDGTPVRATVDVSFKEGESADAQAERNPGPASLPAKIRVVEQGDQLWRIAATEYGAATHWRVIAAANGLTSPRQLEPGTQLVLPRIP